MYLSATLNKAITDFVSFNKEKIIIIKSDNYKPRLSIFFKNPHPSQVLLPALPIEQGALDKGNFIVFTALTISSSIHPPTY